MNNTNPNTPNTPNTDPLVREGEAILRDLNQQQEVPIVAPQAPFLQMRVACGANAITLENMAGYTVEQVRQKMREVLNVTNDHQVVLVNGQMIDMHRPYTLTGNEDLEFKKPAGNKG